ncbi:MAG: hypothetical protein GY756_17600 [bacterium]|nr:hypothetical protein [bacterium]
MLVFGGVGYSKNIVIVGNSVNSLAKARFNLYFVNMSNAISSCIGRRNKTKPIFIDFIKNKNRFKPKIISKNDRIRLTLSKNYSDLLNKATELDIINFLFLDRFGLKPSKKNIENISWITSVILKKFIFLEGSDPSLNRLDTFPIVYSMLLLHKKLKISYIINMFPKKETYGSPIYRLYEECSEMLLYSILNLPDGKAVIDSYVLESCSGKSDVRATVLYKLICDKITSGNVQDLAVKELKENADKYLNQTAYKLVFNSKMPLPIQASIEKFNNLCNVKCYIKNGSKIARSEIKLQTLTDDMDNIINFDDVILYLIINFNILKLQSSYAFRQPLENIIKDLYLLKDKKNINSFGDNIIKYEQQLYYNVERYKKIALYLNSAEDKFINMSIKYHLYLDLIRNDNDLIKEVWPELHDYFIENN